MAARKKITASKKRASAGKKSINSQGKKIDPKKTGTPAAAKTAKKSGLRKISVKKAIQKEQSFSQSPIVA